MYKLSFIQHSDLTEGILNEVIRIKSISWPYSYADQVKWMSDNLKDSDIHVLLSLDNTFVGYLNLIQIEMIINNKPINGLGVGNVCTTIRGNGWGTELILLTNNYFRKYRKTGLLFCRDRLLNFYGLCHWKKINNSLLRVSFNNAGIVTMYFNHPGTVRLLEFTGKIF